MRIASILLGAVCLVILGVIVKKVTGAKLSESIPQPEIGRPAAPVDMDRCLYKSADSSWNWSFDDYLDQVRSPSVSDVRYALAEMDRISRDTIFNRRKLSETLTRYRQKRMAGSLERYQPDSLLSFIQWAEQFQFYAAFDEGNQIFYRSVFSYWMNTVGDKLAAFSQQSPELRHDLKFKYLVMRCKEKHYTIGVKVTSFDKFVENILYSNYGHLVHATWNQSSRALKSVFLLLFILLVMGSFSAMKYTISGIKYITSLIKR